jgi:methyltransferase NSUN6
MLQTTVRDLEAFPQYQRLFVREAVALLKPGGYLTYSTCTIHALENEAMVRHMLDTYPEMKLMPVDVPLGGPGLPGYGLDFDQRQHVRRFDPTDENDTMGFFIAKFQKINMNNSL